LLEEAEESLYGPLGTRKLANDYKKPAKEDVWPV
jgi:hypothetical protein